MTVTDCIDSELENTEWASQGKTTITADNLARLFNNEIPFIRVNDLVSPCECSALADMVSKESLGEYEKVLPVIHRLGCTVFEFDRNRTGDYFKESQRNEIMSNQIFAQTVNPVQRLISMIDRNVKTSVSIAQNKQGQKYYAGLIRRIEKGTELHIDFAPCEQDGWEVCQVVNQLAWNLYLEVGETGTGETVIYNKPWQDNHQMHRSGIYGYSNQVIKGAEKVVLQPKQGELFLFNTRNYHLVTPSEGHRTTVSSAIGTMPSGEIVFWS